MSAAMTHMDLIDQEAGLIAWSRPHVGLVVIEQVTFTKWNPMYYCPFNWTGVV